MSDSSSARIAIKGGAGPMEAAAIAAVIEQIVEDERRASATPSRRRTLPPWVAHGRPSVFTLPRRL